MDEAQPQGHTPVTWYQQLTPREQRQVDACRVYAGQHSEAGLPNHTLMVLVARMAALLEQRERAGDNPAEITPLA